MALTIDKAEVLLIAPELSEVTDAQWDFVISAADDEVATTYLGNQARADRMGTYLAAHLATVLYGAGFTGGGGVAGPLTSVTVGNVSKTFAAPQSAAQAAGNYERTKYGLEYLRLRKTFGPRVDVL